MPKTAEVVSAQAKNAGIDAVAAGAKTLHEFAANLATELGVAEVLRTAGIRVQFTQVWARDSGADEKAEPNFLNSFEVSCLPQNVIEPATVD